MSEHISSSRAITASFAIFVVSVWLTACLILWWAYEFPAIIKAGSESQSQAVSLVVRMAAILTTLVAVATVLNGRAAPQRGVVKSAWSLSWRSVVFLLSYGLLVFSWRESWTPARGVNDSAMFLPLLGPVNARFFAEVGSLIYLMEVAPLLSISSGILYALGLKLIRKCNWALDPNT